VPQAKPGKLAVAFAIFNSTLECHQAIQMIQGAMLPAYAPGAMKAHRGDPSQGGL